ncbi:ABC transporter substrate-binding protein [Anaerocolumna sp. MB42-C2]|uniref:ABC transporter substrate-binding protein n=1 Tax=Anaerocolumna sp. MB42-C2 TaxID=3070997 RepID=UPI0027E07E67|nr:extracellular solute-binding protein [Anaerocolumna sp. MB42-C2]WMJ86942.1 extracellular solute-binding protein [Anaerocolumna sp. MB42-C2]
MKKLKRFYAYALVAVLAIGSLTGCKSKGAKETNEPSKSTVTNDTSETTASETGQTELKEDTINVLLPPVSPTYQDNFDKWTKEFNELYPNLTLKIEPASWEDVTQKLDVQVQAGSPPDIAFVGAGSIPKYIDTGLLLDISNIATKDMLDDFDQNILNYYKNGEGLYGMPAYAEVHGIGGNREMLEAAGIDWKKVQTDGWTYEEFRKAIKAGTIKDGDNVKTYGFVFACSGVTAADYLNIFVKNAGMPDAFNKDLKYAYTSKNFLKLLEALRALIDDGSMPAELSSVDAGKRWNMFLTGQTMITGKGLSVFERSAKLNNDKIDAKDGSAVEGSIKTEYIILPVPTFFGNTMSAAGAIDGYVAFRGKQEPDPEHLKNVAKAMYFLASGQVAAITCNDLYISPICQSGMKAMADLEAPEGKNDYNTKEAALLTSLISEARPDITPELGAKAQKISDEVMVPKFQALLANELTPQEMYDAVKAAAIDAFGEDGIVTD